MLKNVFLSTVAVASLGLSHVLAVGPQEAESSSETSSNPKSLQHVENQLSFSYLTLKNSQPHLRFVFNQPLMNGLVVLASPGIRASEGSYISDMDILNLVEALHPLKSHFVSRLDFKSGLFYSQSSDNDLKKDGERLKHSLTREDYDHFINESNIQLKTRVEKKVSKKMASMLDAFSWDTIEIAASECTLKQVATYNLWKKRELDIFDRSYEGYVRCINQLNSQSNYDELSFVECLDVLPSAHYWNKITVYDIFFLVANYTTDFTPIKGIQRLTRLNMSDNCITDLTPVEDMKGLTGLVVAGNKIAVLTPVAGLGNLRILNVSDNQIAELTPIADLRNLNTLNLSNNPTLWTPLSDECSETSQARIQANREVVRLLRARGCDVKGVPEAQN